MVDIKGIECKGTTDCLWGVFGRQGCVEKLWQTSDGQYRIYQTEEKAQEILDEIRENEFDGEKVGCIGEICLTAIAEISYSERYRHKDEFIRQTNQMISRIVQYNLGLDKNDLEYDEILVQERLEELSDTKILELMKQLRNLHSDAIIFFEAITRPGIADAIRDMVAKFDGNNYGVPTRWCQAHHDVVTSWKPDGYSWDGKKWVKLKTEVTGEVEAKVV